ncbi:type II toxin-antitoxin system HicB family antitoxin [Cedecea davisae]|uniref:type II toxin-antitoxin system HicB family antitoxin n=1 Tax=Cedecea davisae TaxID=158484 RepID=UPI001D09E3F4|nr:type II toxin-antitoxin system HicB family antitoxin [Cedecea davisae]
MFFSVGVELPATENEAFGLVVPALCNDDFGCVSAVDTQADIAPMVQDAVLSIADLMVERGKDITQLRDAGPFAYAANPDYAYCTQWLLVDVDLSALEGKQLRLNIMLPDALLRRIDSRVKQPSSGYRDRSHFLAIAARHELQSAGNDAPGR